jgi:integrase
MTVEAISPLRRRMIEEMTIRHFSPKTQQQYIRAVKNFADFFGRSPDKATFEDIRRYQLHVAKSGVGVPTQNATMTALRFFFRVTLRRPEVTDEIAFSREPRRLPVVLSPDEVARLLAAVPGIKCRAALSAAYAAGLRVAEIVSLKIGDIDSTRMVIRVDQGKGRKDRYVMLSPHLLDLLRAYWKAVRPRGWLFSGPCPGAAADDPPDQPRLPYCRHAGRDREAGLPAHAAAQLCYASVGEQDRHSRHPGLTGPQEARHHRALHSCGHQGDRRGHQPARPSPHRGEAARVKRGRSCHGHPWRSRISSAITDRHGAAPTSAM